VNITSKKPAAYTSMSAVALCGKSQVLVIAGHLLCEYHLKVACSIHINECSSIMRQTSSPGHSWPPAV